MVEFKVISTEQKNKITKEYPLYGLPLVFVVIKGLIGVCIMKTTYVFRGSEHILIRWIRKLFKKEIPIVHGVTIVGSNKIDSNDDHD